MAEIIITLRKNGPYRVEAPEGAIRIQDAEGVELTIPKVPFSLCRCGASATKPFCDGTHSRIGFDAAAIVVPESRE